MNLFVFILLIVSVSWHSTCCKTVTTTDRPKIIPSSIETSTTKSIDNPTEREFLWTNLFPKENSSKIQELKKIANIKVDPSNRKSKILRSLAFLAGLSFSGSTNEQPSNVKFHPVAANLDASRVSPQIAAIYNPYSYLAHPYIVTAPLGFYPLWDLLRLQSFGGMHNNFQSLPENLQTLNLSDDNKGTDASSNNDEFVNEAKKVENVKILNESEDTTELEAEDDRIVEEKMPSDTACGVLKKMNTKQIIPSKDVSKLSETNDIEQVALANQSAKNKTVIKNNTSTTTVSTVQNSTDNFNYTNHWFGGYYGGYPQNINHIDLTTETNDYKYHEYDHVNYNLPSYDKPVNFYTDQRYNYYSAPSDPYLPNQFHQEQIPEYFSNDFKRYVYSSDNTASFSNSDFRPAV